MKNKEKNEFKTTLRFLRQKNHLTQTELGNILGYGCTAISSYEKGRNEPSISDLIKLADFFKVSVDFLLGRKTNEIRTDYELLKHVEDIKQELINVTKKMDIVVNEKI